MLVPVDASFRHHLIAFIIGADHVRAGTGDVTFYSGADSGRFLFIIVEKDYALMSCNLLLDFMNQVS